MIRVLGEHTLLEIWGLIVSSFGQINLVGFSSSFCVCSSLFLYKIRFLARFDPTILVSEPGIRI
ncbi:hypothetical protein HanRHA438_Chr12g0566941 [Helianthus annuus]|nr:hypothetical protein HanRHA438_Chr12g0566941 [Helianthus annuus]